MSMLKYAYESRMRSLIQSLAEASEAYYNGHEKISDYEYDKLWDELKSLEDASGIVLEGSPTRKVGFPIKVSKLSKITHEFPAKSLDKTKDIDKLVNAFKVRNSELDEVVVMWKLDGSTVQLTYDGGHLISAATRGDGYVGQDITHNAPYIKGIPLTVKDTSKFTVRGEATISYEDFETINSQLEDSEKFKNPRNLAAASITMLDPEDMKYRNVEFHAFELVSHPELQSKVSFYRRLTYLSDLDFYVVPKALVGVKPGHVLGDLKSFIQDYPTDATKYPIPVDGLVVVYDDSKYTDNLKGTEHHPHILKGYAYKWADEVARTTLKAIEWSPSRTGLLNPVAVFDPVELEGTTVSRASLHNVSVIRNFKLKIGDEIGIYKANKIIPQVSANFSKPSKYDDQDLHSLDIVCPTCKSAGIIETSKDGIESAYCSNPLCSAKLIYKFEHFCERSAMDIEGLSESTITKFVNLGYLKEFSDIYKLDNYKSAIMRMEGFGDKSWTNIWEAIHRSRKTTFVKLIVGLGIPNIGTGQAKALSKYFEGNVRKFLDSKYLDFSVIDGIGSIVSNGILTWLHNDEIQDEVEDLLPYLEFEDTNQDESNKVLEGLSFVITGSLTKYKNRGELVSAIESQGGKVLSAVSSNTDYLINNDVNSTSSKNKTAKSLNVPIITEDEFIQMFNMF